MLRRLLRPRPNRALRDHVRYYLILAIAAVVVLGMLAGMWDRLGTEQ